MYRKNSFIAAGLLVVVAGVLTIFSVSCNYQGRPLQFCTDYDDLPVTGTIGGGDQLVFETPGTIKVIHGWATATKDSGQPIRVERTLDIPAYANKATVFLNGWKAGYIGGDQNVVGLGTLIGKIKLEGTKLTWNAVGIIRDNDGHEAYQWTYYYTVIAWNNAALNVLVNHDDADTFCKANTGGTDNFYFTSNSDTTTALSTYSSFLRNTDFPPIGTVAILPRGFGLQWLNDHNLLQVAYNLDHSETFLEYNKKYKKAFGEEIAVPSASPGDTADARFVSWTSQAILKDNDLKRDYEFGEMDTALGGSDVGVLQPPFSILPKEATSGCSAGSGDVPSQEIVIDNIPFEYAIPMLTGWELGYPCNDENVKEIGIWIDEWSYVKDPGAATGTLRYKLSSTLRDDDGYPMHYRNHKLTILGLRSTAVTAPTQKSADLVVISPSGNSESAFCRLEQNKKLRVTVKNQGNSSAPASKTTVTFGDTPVTLNTPAIAPGGSVDLLFDLPAGCANAACSFKITVDSRSQVNELNMEANNSADGRCRN